MKTYANTRRRLMIMLGLVLAILAGTTAFMMGDAPTEAEPLATTLVLVAAVDIPARTAIDAGHMVSTVVPVDDALAGALTDASQALGLITEVPIPKGQPITPNLFVATAAGLTFSVLAPTETVGPDSPYWRAASVQVKKDRAVGGLIEVGQRVDLMTTVGIKIFTRGVDGEMKEGTSQEGYYSEVSTKVAWPDLEVLSINREEDIYILKVSLHDAEEIGHLQDGGTSFGMVLRPSLDTRPVDVSRYGETTNRIIVEHGFPLPQIIETSTWKQPLPGTAEAGPSSPAPSSPAPVSPSMQPAASPAP